MTKSSRVDIDARYNHSPKGRERNRNYRLSPKYTEVKHRYQTSPKGRESLRSWKYEQKRTEEKS